MPELPAHFLGTVAGCDGARRRAKMEVRYGDLLTRAHTNGDDHSGGALVRLADRRAS